MVGFDSTFSFFKLAKKKKNPPTVRILAVNSFVTGIVTELCVKLQKKSSFKLLGLYNEV